MPLQQTSRVGVLAVACAAFLMAACGDDDGQGPDATTDSAVLDAAPADAAPADAAPTDAETPLPGPSVISLNLRCLMDDWDARLPIVIDELAAANPDLLGLQEVCAETAAGGRDNLAELTSALTARTGRTYQVVRTVTHLAWDTYDEGLAVLTPHAIEADEVVSLPAGAFPRKVVLTRVAAPGGALVFATTHLDHQDASVRAQQAAALLTALNGFAGSSEARIVTGDFNEGPTGDVYSTLAAAGLTDVWGVLHPGDPGHTFPASGPTMRIDYVWLDGAHTGLAPGSIQRILDAAVGGVFGSDHIGLHAQLQR